MKYIFVLATSSIIIWLTDHLTAKAIVKYESLNKQFVSRLKRRLKLYSLLLSLITVGASIAILLNGQTINGLRIGFQSPIQSFITLTPEHMGTPSPVIIRKVIETVQAAENASTSPIHLK